MLWNTSSLLYHAIGLNFRGVGVNIRRKGNLCICLSKGIYFPVQTGMPRSQTFHLNCRTAKLKRNKHLMWPTDDVIWLYPHNLLSWQHILANEHKGENSITLMLFCFSNYMYTTTHWWASLGWLLVASWQGRSPPLRWFSGSQSRRSRMRPAAGCASSRRRTHPAGRCELFGESRRRL